MNVCSPDIASDDRSAPALVGGERYRGMLEELAALGMDLARMVHRRAAALDAAAGEAGSEESPAVAEATVAFDRAARCVRRTVGLLRLLDTPVPQAADRRVMARRRIIRVAEDVIAKDHGDGERAESLRAELYERMDVPELDDEIDGRPVEEVIADILRDLGIAGPPGMRHPWQRRTPDEVAALCARARHAASTAPVRVVSTAAAPPWAGGGQEREATERLALALAGRSGCGPPGHRRG